MHVDVLYVLPGYSGQLLSDSEKPNAHETTVLYQSGDEPQKAHGTVFVNTLYKKMCDRYFWLRKLTALPF